MMNKGTQKQSPRRCIFCGGTGLSKEHIWSDWLGKIIPRSDDHSQSIIRDVPGPDRIRIVEPFLYSHQGSMNSRKLRNVCKKCNNGWMSAIVNRAKPSAEMIRDLAAWISLSSVMAEFTDLRTAVIPATDRKHLWIHEERDRGRHFRRWSVHGLSPRRKRAIRVERPSTIRPRTMREWTWHLQHFHFAGAAALALRRRK
jgi:hypothetical protein